VFVRVCARVCVCVRVCACVCTCVCVQDRVVRADGPGILRQLIHLPSGPCEHVLCVVSVRMYMCAHVHLPSGPCEHVQSVCVCVQTCRDGHKHL
jgi:hypothetical protein